MQKNEITEYNIYYKIASILKKNDPNKKILTEVAEDEKNHYSKIKEITQCNIKPNKIKIPTITITIDFLFEYKFFIFSFFIFSNRNSLLY